MADPVTLAATTVLTAGSKYAQGRAAKASADNEAQQIFANALRREQEGEAMAAAERRRMRIGLSNARAAMAASGGVTTDAQAQRQLGDIAGEHEYNALGYLYEAQSDAAGMRRAAYNRKAEGSNMKRAATVGAFATALDGGHQSWTSFSEWRKQR